MPKPADVKSEQLLEWDRFRDKPPDEALHTIYSHADVLARRVATWYWKSIAAKRRRSLAARSCTFVLLFAGTVLPILAGLDDESSFRLKMTQSGVAALALAGLIQLADRVFGWSSGWLRYMATVTTIENLIHGFEIGWASSILGLKAPIEPTAVAQLFDKAKDFERAILELQAEETNKWVADYNAGMALLDTLIKSQREFGEREAEAARANLAARKTGSIELELKFKSKVQKVTVAVDKDPPEEFYGISWARAGLSPGSHAVTVVASEPPGLTIRRIIQVEPASTSKLVIELQ